MVRTGLPVLAGAFAISCAFAGPPPQFVPSSYAKIGLPNPSETRAILERFRSAGIGGGGSCYLEFQLRELPRRGPERDVGGRLWASRNESGPVLRITLGPDPTGESSLLVQGGAKPALWRSLGSSAPQSGDLMAPLVEGADLTAFDLTMPFLYWPDTQIVSVERVLGRPANCFVFRPPADFSAVHPEIAAVRADLDAEFNAPVQTQLIGRDGRPLKTLSLVDLKRVNGQWIVKELDVRNEATRDKVRFEVTGAALGLDLSQSLFEVDTLNSDVGAPSQVVRFGR